MNILVVYATYSSGTETATNSIQQWLEENGYSVLIKNALDTSPQDLLDQDLIVLGSPSWMVDKKDGQPHDNFFQLMNKCSDLKLNNKSFAVFGLGDTAFAHFCGAVDVLENFMKKRGGKQIIDSLKIDSFYFEEEKNEILLQQWLEKLHQLLKK